LNLKRDGHAGPPPIHALPYSAALPAVNPRQSRLGLFHFGDKDENSGPGLRLARHSIDLLALMREDHG
jgi:hypothetical protein